MSRTEAAVRSNMKLFSCCKVETIELKLSAVSRYNSIILMLVKKVFDEKTIALV
jgi:hypothetical protein